MVSIPVGRSVVAMTEKVKEQIFSIRDADDNATIKEF